MNHSLDVTKLLDRLSSDLRVSLQILDLSKNATISSLFAHVKVRILGQYQKIWERSCIRQISTEGFITFDESSGEIVSISGGLSNLIKDSNKIKKIVIEACDVVPNNLTLDKIAWDEIKSQSTIKEELPGPTFVDLTSSYDPSMVLESDKNTEPDYDDSSWGRIYEFFSKEKAAVLLHIRKMMGQFSLGEKWSRMDFFPSTGIIGEARQRDFLARAVEDGLFGKEGEYGSRRYWINPDRTDCHSFQLIVKLTYPGKVYDISSEPNEIQEDIEDKDEVIERLTLRVEQYFEIVKDQAERLKRLEKLAGIDDGNQS